MVQQSLTNFERIETTILSNLFYEEDYARKVLPFLKEDYFPLRTDKILFTEIYKFVEKYNNLPTKESISIELGQRKDINEDEIGSEEIFLSSRQQTFDENTFSPHVMLRYSEIQFSVKFHVNKCIYSRRKP